MGVLNEIYVIVSRLLVFLGEKVSQFSVASHLVVHWYPTPLDFLLKYGLGIYGDRWLLFDNLHGGFCPIVIHAI